MTEADIAYAAGFFDGEGSITIERRSYKEGRKPTVYLRLDVCQIVPEPLEFLKSLFGGSVGMMKRHSPKRMIWRWTVTARMAGNVLKRLRPYLKVKSQEADIALEWFDMRNTKKGSTADIAPVEDQMAYQEAMKQIRKQRSNAVLRRDEAATQYLMECNAQ